MDLYVERQCLKNAQGGSRKDFLMLYDANFDNLYKYIYRRIEDNNEAKSILELTFHDAIGQLEQFDEETSFMIWLFKLAKARITTYYRKTNISTAAKIRLDDLISLSPENEDIVEKIDKMMNKLSFDEREIVRLKLLDEVSDSDVMYVLGEFDEGIGTKIYRVLKRVNVLLFNNDSESSGVYFGKITGLFENVRSIESFYNTDAFKMILKEDLRSYYDRKDLSIDVPTINTEATDIADISQTTTKNTNMTNQTGSNDPAKIFVEAVKEMKEQEAIDKIREERAIERKEALYEIFDKFKVLLLLIPLLIFFVIIFFVGYKLIDFKKIEPTNKIATSCSTDIIIEYSNDITNDEKHMLADAVSNNACDAFDDLQKISFNTEDERVKTTLAFNDYVRKYDLVKIQNQFIITRYAKTLNSDS